MPSRPPTAPEADADLTRVRRLVVPDPQDPEGDSDDLLCFETEAGGACVVSAATEAAEAMARWIDDGTAVPARDAAATLSVPVLDPALPLLLQPVAIPKAWGEERWLTGIEARGVAAVGTVDATVPLPWALAALPKAFGGIATPILVKVLAPSPSADSGDLYFEVHRDKEEVYVVTDVDEDAWPDGWARVRYGFRPESIEALGENGFRLAFTTAAHAHTRAQRSLGRQPLPRGEVPPGHPLANVRRSRARLESMLNIRGLEIGDVVRVPPGLPHGLMHGVRVVEFQTPEFERRVLYAAQALAPADTPPLPELLADVRLDVPQDPPPKTRSPAEGVRTSRIARMRDFDVHRFELDAGAATVLPRAPYAVLVGVGGTPSCGGVTLQREQAALLSGTALLRHLEADDEPAAALLAIPH
jgi:hypothetical protein